MVVIHFHNKYQKLLERTMVPIDDKYLKSIRMFDYFAIIFIGIITIPIYILHEYITQYIEPDQICGNRFVYEIMTWIFPKMMRHCDAISIKTYWSIHAKIGIIWNLWLLVIYMYSAILGFHFFLAVYKKRKNEVRGFVAERRMSFIFPSLAGFLMIIFCSYYVLFGLPIPEHGIPIEWELFREDRYGIHAILETLCISFFTYMFFSRILFVLLICLDKRKFQS